MNARLADIANPIADRAKALVRGGAASILIAIDGRSGVGKSTIARYLRNVLNAALICGDDFFAGAVTAPTSPVDAAHLADGCIDRRRLRAVLTTLKSGRAVVFHAFDWDAFDGRLCTTQTRVEPRPVLILEGVYAGHPDLRDLADLLVLIDAPAEERDRRLLAREGALTQWERQWRHAEDWYFTHLSPADQFDLVISNA